MAITFKKIVKECVRPFKQIVSREKYGFKLKLKESPSYHEDWLISFHNTSFLQSPSFIAAYQRGVKATGEDYRFRWRVHVALWVAAQAIKLEGAFVECGVNKGFLSSAIMHYLNWNSLDKSFFLFDTFQGFDPSCLTEKEKGLGRLTKDYSDSYEEVKRNFNEFKNVFLVKGSVPSSLKSVDIEKISYLSLDMNCAIPEIAAAKYFWPKMTKGGFILLDDYAYLGFQPQNEAFNAFAKEMHVDILSLPTGQGLIMKN